MLLSFYLTFVTLSLELTPTPLDFGIVESESEAFDVQALEYSDAMVKAEAYNFVFPAVSTSSVSLVSLPSNPRREETLEY